MDLFFLNPYTAAHVGMLIQPLMIVTLSASLGTKAAAGAPRFDAGWSATEAPVTNADAIGLMTVHYIVHNFLWLLHIWRALHPDRHELVVSHAAQWAILGVGLVSNMVCVLPAATVDVIGVSREFDWLFVPVMLHANSFLLTRVCWTWLVCVQVIVFDSDWRVKALVIAWLIMDVTSLLVLRVATLPALAITLLVAAWAYRRFGWRRTSSGTVAQPHSTTPSSSSAASATAAATKRTTRTSAAAATTRPKRTKPKQRTNGAWTAAAVASPESSSDEDDDDDDADDNIFGKPVFEIGDAKDDIDERRRANVKRAAVAAVASTHSAPKAPVRPESV